MSLGLPIYPTKVLDLADLFGAAEGVFVLRRYDGTHGFRFTFGGEPEGEGIEVPAAAMASFQALVGGQQLFVSAPVDLTAPQNGIPLVPSTPGYFLVPSNNDPLMVVLVSSAGTLTTSPVIRAGNPSSGGNYGGGSGGAPLDAGTFGAAAKTIRSSFLESLITMADLTTPITVDVVTGATGTGGFGWTVRFAITGSIVPAF